MKVEIEITDEMIKQDKEVVVLTALELAKKITMVVFDSKGMYYETCYYKSRKQASKASRKYLQKSSHLGHTIKLHEEYATFTTHTPVVEVK